jgi:hypothetical protein
MLKILCHYILQHYSGNKISFLSFYTFELCKNTVLSSLGIFQEPNERQMFLFAE